MWAGRRGLGAWGVQVDIDLAERANLVQIDIGAFGTVVLVFVFVFIVILVPVQAFIVCVYFGAGSVS